MEWDAMPAAAVAEELQTMFKQLTGREAEFLRGLSSFDRRGGWALLGFKSCAAWLSRTTGIRMVTAREKVRVARVLHEGLPRVRAALAAGDIAYAAARSLCRLPEANAETEASLVAAAMAGATVRELDDLVQRARDVLDRDGSEKAAEKEYAGISLTLVRGLEGRVLLAGEFPAEEGECLLAAIDRLLASERARPVDAAASTGETAQRTPLPHRKAQALLALVQAGLDNEAFAYPTRGRAEVLVVVDYDTLTTGAAGQAELRSGHALTAEAVRRLCCDSGIRRVVTAGGSQVLDVGRISRIATPAQRAAAWVRDRGCRFPGCGRRWGLQMHHLVEFNGPDQGETNLADLIWVCWDDHHACHEGHWTVTGDANHTLLFHPPGGGDPIESKPYAERLAAA